MTSVATVSNQLVERLESGGYKSRMIRIEHLQEVGRELEARRRDGSVDRDLFAEYLTSLDLSVPASLPEARSIIMVAAPQPEITVDVHWHGRRIRLVIPPTYVHDPDGRAEAIIRDVLGANGYEVARARVPEKSLAVRSGLARYGRNNLAYVEGMGSCHRLVGFYSTLPCPEDNWGEPEHLPACATCRACARHCPSGAIDGDRFLIRAERCLTFHNERRDPFPAWIDPGWHHCLVGCLRCQSACPANTGFGWRQEFREEFSEAETILLLDPSPDRELPQVTRQKLERLDLIEYLDILPRNLAAVLENMAG